MKKERPRFNNTFTSYNFLVPHDGELGKEATMALVPIKHLGLLLGGTMDSGTPRSD